MIRLGLCCAFRDQPIKFGTTTATSLARMGQAPTGHSVVATLRILMRHQQVLSGLGDRRGDLAAG